jgi:WD40 repeat protein
VYGVDYTPDGRRLASGGNDATVRIWDTSTGAQLLQLRGHEQYVKSVLFRPDGRQLASASGDGTVRLWSIDSPAARRRTADADARGRHDAERDAARRLTADPDLETVARRTRAATDLTPDERRAALDAVRRRSRLAP